MKKIISLMVLILILAVVGISGCTSSNNKVFENQYIKFNYSSNLNIVDNSNNTTLNVTIYDGNVDPSDYQINAVGTIRVGSIDKNLTIPNYKNATISGYEALVGYDNLDSGAIIYLNDTTGLAVLLNPDHDSYVNTIVSSFVVKKAPP